MATWFQALPPTSSASGAWGRSAASALSGHLPGPEVETLYARGATWLTGEAMPARPRMRCPDIGMPRSSPARPAAPVRSIGAAWIRAAGFVLCDPGCAGEVWCAGRESNPHTLTIGAARWTAVRLSCTSSSLGAITRGSGSGARRQRPRPSRRSLPHPDPYPATRAACAGAGGMVGPMLLVTIQDGGQQEVAPASRARAADQRRDPWGQSLPKLTRSHAPRCRPQPGPLPPGRRKAVADKIQSLRGRIQESVTLL